MGRPQGRPIPDLSLAPVAEYLGDRLGTRVAFVRDAVGRGGEDAVFALDDGEVALLENTRFQAGETVNDPELSASWSGLTDLFVNDAFGAAHRAHASTAGLARAVRERGGEAVAGLLMARELEFLRDALESPERPFVAILGGAKISGKIDVVEALLPRVDRLLIGGAMANTFFRAMDLATGESLIEEDRIDMAAELLESADDKLTLPIDCVVAREVSPDAPTRVVARADVGDTDRIVDVGPETRALYRSIVVGARTIVWNGPMGVFEIPAFAAGTVEVARAVADACDRGALGVLGGGQTAAAAEQAGVVERLSHVSTGGGASLALLAGAPLPGVESLSDRE
jgi:phosphoglycerate kinase